METTIIGVGVIGASMDGTWGGTAHLPALQSLPGYRIAAISTTRQASADETAQKFDVPHAFEDLHQLVTHPDVDLVTITVKVPEHDRLVRAAVEAGKHVYCEFPLARSAAEARDLLQTAETRGIRHFVGLQARANPAMAYVKDLILQGYVGKVRAVHCDYALPVYPVRSKQITASRQYLLDNANGANQLTITAGHLLDGIQYMLGDFTEVSAMLETQARLVQVVETGEQVQATSPDHVIINGILENGAILNTHIRNTYSGSLSLSIHGTEGDLILQSVENNMFQMDSFIVKGTQQSTAALPLTIPAHYHLLLPTRISAGPALQVAGLYEQIYKDLQNDTSVAPSFHTAVKVHELLDHVRSSSDTGRRVKL